ncbi:MAG: hypothetical protein MPJ50_11195 [Pirellulales bacterium]|nr:hypothetical protein [Pirellulales bacterium]
MLQDPMQDAIQSEVRGRTILRSLFAVVPTTTLFFFAQFFAVTSSAVEGAETTWQASVSQAEELFRSGKFKEAADMSRQAIDGRAWTERWRHLLIKSELARGRYQQAFEASQEALETFRTSLQVRLLAYEAYLYNGKLEEAEQLLLDVDAMLLTNPRRYSSAESRVALGKFFILRGADARKVLEEYYDVAKRQSPSYPETYFASAELALGKEDFALAAESLQGAPPRAKQDPHYHFLTARAFANSDPAKVVESLEAALAIDPEHVPTLLMQVDKLIDAERYAAARKLIDRVHRVNPHHPTAWAYESAVAHLLSDREGEQEGRDRALAHWPQNPEVDWLIGRKLSQKYRFEEGAAYQRRSLAFRESYLPAKIQLAQDLLRLGEEEEGWRLANEVFATDGYNVLMYNLVTLHDELAGFRTVSADGFLLRMEEREAELYGQLALDVLSRAKATLCAKYDVALQEPIIVEIFPRQRDFAVRTFGLPGAEGYLGVCFGRVITANSPASQGETPSNWESVLWHEFCHVVTLHKTKNKMPRWFSEGISVYEEVRENPAWGQPLMPIYREIMLSDDLPPMSELSASFLSPKSGLHLQFAYFESGLAIEFLIQEYGFDKLNAVLADLGAGKALEAALPIRTGASWQELDEAFAAFVRARAKATASDATWEQPDLSPLATSADIAEWLEQRPNNFPALTAYAAALIREQRHSEAIAPLKQLIELYPEYAGGDNAYAMLATVHRELGHFDEERAVLENLAARTSDSLQVYSRLMEIAEASNDAQLLLDNARRYLAVNPLNAAPHRSAAAAAEELKDVDLGIRALSALAILDDTDPSDLHFRLAQLYFQKKEFAQSRRQVLMALEQAPRFRNAHQLLLQIIAETDGPLRAPDAKRSASGKDARSSEVQVPPSGSAHDNSVGLDLLYIPPATVEDGAGRFSH